jgi:lysyl-tRNA synthetase, class II
VKIPRLRPSQRLPAAAAFGAALVGAVNIGSALTPNIRWRGHLLLEFEPVEAMRLFHALALPAGTALLLVAPYLIKRRRRAWQAAVLLMVALGLFDLLKGLDFEETALTWGAAAILVAGRTGFRVRHDPITVRSAIWRVPLLAFIGVAAVALATWVGGGRHSEWLGLAVRLLELGTLMSIAYVIFRPLAAPRTLPGPAARALAADVVRAHGADTLSFFNLRADKHYFFSDTARSFVGYAIENGVLLLSGDPVGPEEEIGPLLTRLRAFGEVRGLKLGAVGASERMRPSYEELGLRTLYLGDEAVIDLASFSLEGRAIRKVRQSVSRLAKAGYETELHELRSLGADDIAQAERVIAQGRQGAPERGFSMAMDSLCGAHCAETLVVLARDAEGEIRGVLHFVPCYGRPAVSLSFMRRDPRTPNGLTEFLVVRAAELLRERGLEELSLNFATFARWMHSPERWHERVLGRLVSLCNPFFQIESLYRFNAKFFPRWEPRYLVYEGTFGLPRVGLAAMWAEGQLPKPKRPQRRTPAAAR